MEQLGIAFNRRVQNLMNTSLNASSREDLSGVTAKLTLQEKERARHARLTRPPRPPPHACPHSGAVLEAGREATNNYEKWGSRKLKMNSSELVGRKRPALNSAQRANRQQQKTSA